MTPYGAVLQHMHIDGMDGPFPYINPLAFLYYACRRVKQLGELVVDVARKHPEGCSIILYIDECNPGNPLRVGAPRQLQCMYWTIAEFPSSILSSMDGWFYFGLLKSRSADQIEGGLSPLIKHTLRAFWPLHDPSFTDGVQVAGLESHAVFTARFCGLLADESAHKYCLDLKGASGNRCCHDCSNLWKRAPAVAIDGTNIVGLSCPDISALVPHSTSSFYKMVDKLSDAHAVIGKTKFGVLETELGLTYNEHGLLWDKSVRNVFDCTKHVLRDSMHTLASNGLIGTELAFIIPRLAAADPHWSLDIIKAYAQSWILPKRLRSVKSNWFDESFFLRDKTKYFASEEVCIMNLLYMFLVKVVKPSGKLKAELVCFGFLHRIVSLFMMGADLPNDRLDEIDDLIYKHHKLYIEIYPPLAVKEKYHRLLHCTDSARRMGKHLSCWVTERKHSRVKRESTYLFNHNEKTSVLGLVEKQLSEMSSDGWFDDESLINPRVGCIDGKKIETSNYAHLKCGMVHKADMVHINTDDGHFVVGQVVAFFAIDNDVCVNVKLLTPLADEESCWSSHAMVDSIIHASSVIATLFWSDRRGQRIRVIPHVVTVGR